MKETGLSIETARCRQDGVGLLLVRCDHPKFPSVGARWQEWIAALAAVPIRA